MTAMRRLAALAFALPFSISAWPADLAGQWGLKIEDQSHRVNPCNTKYPLFTD
ncbi:hypothetical protein [Zoogloea sp.]|uniref:hypothetical protein n=1 Tax=Zoogloea sp. TaxID=49181 RepID=UPI0035AF442B